MARNKKKKVEHIKLGFVPHKHQSEFFNGWAQNNLLICTRRFGKSVIAALALAQQAVSLNNRKKQPKFAYIAPQKDQAKQITWPIFKEFLSPLIQRGMVHIKEQALEIFFVNSKGKDWAQIKLYAEENNGAESIRGNYLDGVVFDEYDSMDAATVYDEIVAPALEDTDGWSLFAGTIAGKANLYNLYQENLTDPEWNIGVYRFEDVWQDLPAYCEPEQVDGVWVPAQRKFDRIRKRYKNKPNKYGREYQCDWTCDGIDSLIPNTHLEEAVGKHLRDTEYSHAPKVMGIDVAGDGPDSHAICMRQGNHVAPLLRINDRTERELTMLVSKHIIDWSPDAVFIDHTGGYGTELVSRLRQYGFTNIIPINFGSKAADPAHYTNLRSEMFHKLRDWVIEGGALPDDRELEQELSVLSAEETTGGKAQLIKKDDIKELIGRSPDSADALALTFAAPVQKSDSSRLPGGGNKTRATTNYNPLESIGRRRYGVLR